MAHLIDKSALVAEIEKLNPPFYPTLAEKMSYQDAIKDCIDIIYTLEVIEVNIKDEMEFMSFEEFERRAFRTWDSAKAL